MLALLAATAVALFSGVAQSAWTVNELFCHDSDCASGAINFKYRFDNGAGKVTHCGGIWSVWTPPNGWQKCEDESIEWKFSAGERFGGCAGFPMWIRQLENGQQKEIHVGQGTDENYDCAGLVGTCPPPMCQQCNNNECNGYSYTFEPDNTHNDAGYAPGWCGVHITQYQKPDPSKDKYKFDVYLKDANGIEIGKVEQADATNPVGVTSKLPLVFVVTAGNVDADAVCMDYGDQHFCSNDQEHKCNFGAYDSGNRDGDCGFTC